MEISMINYPYNYNDHLCYCNSGECNPPQTSWFPNKTHDVPEPSSTEDICNKCRSFTSFVINMSTYVGHPFAE